MRIIYAGIKNDYLDPKRGNSFEHNNFWGTLKEMEDVEAIYFPIDRILEVGRDVMNQELLDLIIKEKPDIFFTLLFTEELKFRVLDEIKKYTTSIAWMSDDHWRFDNYSKYYAPHFTYVVTTYSEAVDWYGSRGLNNVIRSQWACNTKYWYPLYAEKDIDVSFIGQKTKSREKIINFLKDSGINVFVRGWGWEEGKASNEEILQIIARSKINLNINSALDFWAKKRLGRLFFKRSVNDIKLSLDVVSNFKSYINMGIPQIKARPFELAGCRAFIISGFADDLDKYYKEDEEMVFYRSKEELLSKIKIYLLESRKREEVALAAYSRTLNEHTYEKRFRKIFG